MALFTKVAAKKESAAKAKPKRSTTWRVGDPEGDQVAKAVHNLVDLASQSKAIEAKMEMYKTTVWNHANRQFIADYVEIGAPPETPMKIVNSDGEEVTFVVQDRSGGQWGLKDEQVAQLETLLGEDAAQAIIYTETSFGFNRDVLAHPGVMPVIEEALEKALAKLTDDGILDEDQVEALVEAKQKTSLRPGTYQRLSEITGRDATRFRDFLDIVGSQVTRYVKP